LIGIILLEHAPNGSRQRIGGSAGVVFTIQVPATGVFDDVVADGVQGAFVADDVFVIIPLPDDVYVGVLPRPFGDADFEPRTTDPMVVDVPRGRSVGVGGVGGDMGGVGGRGEKFFAPTIAGGVSTIHKIP